MATELEQLLGEDSKEVDPSLEKEPEKDPNLDKNPEEEKEKEKLANIRKAVADETERLRDIRKKQKLAKQGLEVEEEEEELPEINMKDPGAKAWDKRIRESAAPAQKELEKAKEERRLFALKQFLTDKPALAKNSEKLKAMMETYDRLKTSTELTSEGILMDLEKAYAAEHSDELIKAAQRSRINAAENDAIFSDPAVSRGSSGYSDHQDPKTRRYSADEAAVLAKWGMTPAEHAALDLEMKKKNG